MEKEVEFNGRKYHLVSGGRYYIRYSKLDKDRKGARGLHVDVYEHFSGKIVEKGFEVHHKDGNHFNNNYENLECLTAKEHRKIHSTHRKPPTDFYGQNKAREWHGSEEGLVWHKKHGKEVFGNMPFNDFNCKECGVEYKSKNKVRTYFCSTKCRQRFYRDNGIGMVDKICNYCNSPFKTKKRAKMEAVSCSRRCSIRFAIENKALIVNNKTGRFEKSRNQEDEN